MTAPLPVEPVEPAGPDGAEGDGLSAHLVVDRAPRPGSGSTEGFRLDVRLTARPGEVLALLGPNGAGKSTALRALAGLTPLSAGQLTLDGRTLEQPSARLRIAPEDRPVGVVFQDYLLFPHLSALDNVAFGLRTRGVRKSDARAEAAGWLERVGLADHATARPRALSGGQQQRVALARALAPHPRLLLLDEPMAALDARTRLDVRSQLRRHLAAFDAVAVLVTHDPLDAMVLADRLTVIEDGRVVQDGPPAEIARHPRSDYIARLVGLNLFRGTADGHEVTVDGSPDRAGDGGEAVRITTGDTVSGPVFVAFPPAAVTVHRSRPDTSARNVWQATVVGMELHGDQVRLDLAGALRLTADLTQGAVAELGLVEGSEVWAAVKATQTHAYPG
jgi:molybdate transport system ATP-binding protein